MATETFSNFINGTAVAVGINGTEVVPIIQNGTTAQVLLATLLGLQLPRVVAAAGGITALATDNLIIVNKGVGAPTNVTLVSNPVIGQKLTIKDGKGDAVINPITVIGGTIDGHSSFLINISYAAVTFVYNGNQWNTI